MSSSSKVHCLTTACTYILCTWYDASASNQALPRVCAKAYRHSYRACVNQFGITVPYFIYSANNTLALYKEGRPLLRGTVECKL